MSAGGDPARNPFNGQFLRDQQRMDYDGEAACVRFVEQVQLGRMREHRLGKDAAGQQGGENERDERRLPRTVGADDKVESPHPSAMAAGSVSTADVPSGRYSTIRPSSSSATVVAPPAAINRPKWVRARDSSTAAATSELKTTPSSTVK
jgi:hypothetical protein